MKKIFKIIIVLMMVVTLFGCSKKVEEPVFDTAKLDIKEGIYLRDDTKSEEELGTRYVTKGSYEFKARPKYGYNDVESIDKTGLDNLNVSASGQFSEQQFLEILDNIKKLAGGKEVYIVDLRSESHGFLNGRPCSIYKYHNTANVNKKNVEIEKEEIQEMNNMLGKEIIMYTIDSDEFTGESEYFKVTDVKTEKQLVESVGFNYLRYTCIDHRWPEDNKLLSFIDFLKDKDLDNIWLHFHCSGGVGRTGVYLALYDMIKNPTVSLEDIVARQCILGAKDLLAGGKEGSWKKEYADEVKVKIRQLYDDLHK